MSDADTVDVSSQLTIWQADVNTMIAHAKLAAPNEACGLMAGGNGTVKKVYALDNADHSPVTYRIDSRDQFRAFRDAEDCGWDIIGCFHSHVCSEAYPSATDIRQAFYPEWIYALVSLRDPESVLRAFRISEGVVAEIPVTVKSG